MCFDLEDGERCADGGQVHDVSGGCGSMYAIEIASQRFKGLNMMKQHRMVNEVLAEEIRGWHGVQLKTEVE
jgi:stress-induced morphogen